MVFVSQDQSGLQELIPQLGGLLRGVLQQRRQQSNQQAYGNILNEEFSQLSSDSSPLEYQTALAKVMARGVPTETALQYGNLLSTLRKSEPKSPFGGKSEGELVDLFKSLGMDRETAERNASLYNSFTTGGQTKFAEMLIDQLQRGKVSGAQGSIGLKKKNSLEPNSPDADVEASQEIEWEWPEVNPFEGMTPREAINHRGRLFKENNAHFGEISSQLKNSKRELRDIDQLKRLNDSGKLPKGMKKAILVDYKKGELRVPAFANAETQQFIKTVNGFIRNAKDFFGSRVTNFDLQTFLQILPTLANSEEGRRNILEQMEAATQLNQLDNDSLKEVYEHYGLDKIDRLQLESLARDIKSPKEGALEEKFANSINAQLDFDFKSKTPTGRVPMVSPDGERVYILEEEVEEAGNQGFKKA